MGTTCAKLKSGISPTTFVKVNFMAMKIQTRTARKNRLMTGCCPLHGCRMHQIDIWYESAQGQRYTFVGCMHYGCEVEAMVDESFCDYELTEQWRYLMEQADSGSALVIAFPSTEERAARVGRNKLST